MNEELKVVISAEIGKLKQGVADAKKQLSGFKEQVSKASADVDKNFKAIGASIGNGLKSAATAGATALAGVATALLGTAAATEEYRNNQALLASAFESAGSSAEAAKTTYNDLYRVLGDGGQATEAAQHLAKLTTEEEALAEWTNICKGVYSEFSGSLAIEGLTEAVNHTAKLGEVQGTLADALEWSGISVDAFNEQLAACSTEAEREQLIRETLNGIYAESAANYEKNNAQILAQREEQAKLQDNLAKLGEVMTPVLTAFTSFANDALAKVVPYVQQLAETYLPMLQPALEKTAEIVGKVGGFVVDNWGIIAAVAGVLAGIAAAIGLYNAVAAVKAAMDAAQVTTLWGLVAAYAAQAAAMIVAIAPYVLIVAAIAAVIAIIVVCVKHWDKIKAKVAEVWEAIKQKTKAAVDAVVNWFTQLKDKIAAKVEEMKQAVVNKFNEIKSGISEKISAARDAVQNAFNRIKSIFTGKISIATFDEIKSGIKSKIESARDAVKNAIDKIKSFFNFSWSLPKLKMPSISITGKFSLNPLSVPKFSIQWNELGGVFDKPTLFNYGGSLQGIGENGAEAVVPLENNLQWLDKLAGMLNERMGGGRPIVLQVDGKAFAEISVDSINQLTRQRGSLPLKIM